MAGVTVTKEFAAPVDRVFDTLTDFHKSAELIRGISKMEVLTDGPVGAGTRFRETRTMFGRDATEEMEVVSFERPDSYTLLCDNHGCRYRTDVRFHPAGSGTRLEMEFDAQPLTLFARVMSVVMRPMIKMCAKAMDDDLEDIRAAVESDGSTAGANVT